jgi:UDP-N-acetylmuramoylalanine--D-glutamate ligase
MTISELKGKKVAVIGAGVEGIASAEWLVKHGAGVSLLDKHNVSENEILSKMLVFQDDKVRVISGDDYLKNLEQYDLVVRSPGIKLDLPELVAAKEKGREITSQTKLFFELCPAPIIGVTGTKGKGTTASLIAEMLRAEGLETFLGGNIGVPPLTFLHDVKPTSWVVLELSSFQLEDLQKSPHIAVMLMIVSEHLGKDSMGTQNYHETMEEYVDAKRNIVKWQTPQDFAVLNRDYPATNESDVYTEGKVFHVSREREAAEDGCFVRQERLIVRRDGKESELMEMSEIQLPGMHNRENICAAVMAATLAGVSKRSIISVLQTFKGLEHRLELVREVRGVKYYDDSFSTTPETAIAAIESFDAPEILILGGSSKNSNFSELGELISTRVNIRAVIGIGVEWPRIKESIGYKVASIQYIEGKKTMEEIVRTAAEVAKPGDVVLLTPACASFDMFKSYKDRGEQFKAAVQSL